MLKNYLKVAIRNLARDKTITVINVFGLAVGLACCFLMLLWADHELGFDRFHPNADRVFRVVEDVSGSASRSGSCSAAWVAAR